MIDRATYSIDLLPKRIRDKIMIVGECWIWTAYVIKQGARQGYGRVSFRGYGGPDVWWAHRVTYTLLVGPIPKDLQLDHLIESGICTDTRCCNPAHTEPVTSQVNLLRSPKNQAAIHSNKVACPKGHPYSHKDINGARRCRLCHTQDEARRRERLRNAAVSR